MSDLYDRDFYAWTREQADLLREGHLPGADIAHIAEEIEALGRNEKRELRSRLSVLFLHLLKWRYQPGRRGRSWELSIANARDELAELLADSPSLRATPVGRCLGLPACPAPCRAADRPAGGNVSGGMPVDV